MLWARLGPRVSRSWVKNRLQPQHLHPAALHLSVWPALSWLSHNPCEIRDAMPLHGSSSSRPLLGWYYPTPTSGSTACSTGASPNSHQPGHTPTAPVGPQHLLSTWTVISLSQNHSGFSSSFLKEENKNPPPAFPISASSTTQVVALLYHLLICGEKKNRGKLTVNIFSKATALSVH